MKIDSIAINNFRIFEDKKIEFNSKFNVIIGDNGVGKTSLLEAITVSLNPFLKVVTGKNLRPIKTEDIRRTSYSNHSEEKLFCSIKAVGDMPVANSQWQIVRERLNWGYMKTDTALVSEATKDLVRRVVDGDLSAELPLVKYYGTVRFQRDIVGGLKDEFKGKSSRLDVYPQALNPFSSITQFTDWFKRMELASLQGKEESRKLAMMVKTAVAKSVPGWEELRYDIDEGSLQALMGNNKEWMPIRQLSDGQKTVMAMVADLVYRCIILNPMFEIDAAKETGGIVLIDELDIHLHPNWQRKIVIMLKEIFPKIQFITTTHSPFIVQSLKNEELIDLQGKDYDSDYVNKGIEEIAENEMNVTMPEKSLIYKEMEDKAEEYLRLIDQLNGTSDRSKIDAIESKLKDIEDNYRPFNPAYSALLRSERKAKIKNAI